VGLTRDAYRHPPQMSAQNSEISEHIKEIAYQRTRWGYRMIHDVVARKYPGINHKRVYRLYSEAKLAMRKRKSKRRSGVRVPLISSNIINETWSIDFVSDALSNYRRIKCFTVADDCSHECVEIAVDFGINSQYVTRVLDQVARFKGYPKYIRSDNGPEFTSRHFMAWCQEHGITHILIQPGRPMQNAYIESFNGTFRDECLNENVFTSLAHARQKIATWKTEYNEYRPHSSCGRVPPAEFAVAHREATRSQNVSADQIELNLNQQGLL
jgi:putative transposase